MGRHRRKADEPTVAHLANALLVERTDGGAALRVLRPKFERVRTTFWTKPKRRVVGFVTAAAAAVGGGTAVAQWASNHGNQPSTPDTSIASDNGVRSIPNPAARGEVPVAHATVSNGQIQLNKSVERPYLEQYPDLVTYAEVQRNDNEVMATGGLAYRDARQPQGLHYDRQNSPDTRVDRVELLRDGEVVAANDCRGENSIAANEDVSCDMTAINVDDGGTLSVRTTYSIDGVSGPDSAARSTGDRTEPFLPEADQRPIPRDVGHGF